jgi:hypothetical protein
MKKFLRFLVILIAVVIAGVLILALVEPTDATVTRTALINAPKNAVFGQIVNFKNWPNWSPWYQMEPTMKITYSGTDGQAGSGYHWVGGEKTGEGEMTNKAVTGTQMDYDLAFVKPHSGKAQGFIKADDTAGMTKVTWSVSMHCSFPMNAMLAFMNMDKMLGGDFENGLSNMKKYVESHPTAGSDVDIKEVDFPLHTYLGVRQTVNWSDIQKFCGDTYGMVGKEAGPKINGPAMGIYYTWDTVKKCADMFAGFPMYDTTKPVKGASFVNVAQSKAYMAVHKGSYSNSMKYHMALGKYVAGKGQHPALVIEEYLVGPHQEPDSNKWVTNIYYLVQ